MPMPLAAIYLVWFVWGISWLAASRWRARAAVDAGRRATWPPLAVAALGFLGLFVEAPIRLHPLWRAPPLLGWPLAALALAGAAFAWWARLHLGALWSGGIVRRDGHRIIESGPYALVRHPIYTGLIAAAAALALVKATPLALAGALLLTTGFAWKATVEERFLAAELGVETYAAYRARVPMLLPRR